MKARAERRWPRGSRSSNKDEELDARKLLKFIRNHSALHALAGLVVRRSSAAPANLFQTGLRRAVPRGANGLGQTRFQVYPGSCSRRRLSTDEGRDLKPLVGIPGFETFNAACHSNVGTS